MSKAFETTKKTETKETNSKKHPNLFFIIITVPLIIIALVAGFSIGKNTGIYIGTTVATDSLNYSISHNTTISHDLSKILSAVNEDSYKGLLMAYGVNDSTVSYLLNTTAKEDDFVKESRSVIKKLIGVKDIKLLRDTFDIKQVEIRNVLGQHHTFNIDELVN